MKFKNSAPSRHCWMRTEIYSSHRITYVRFRWGKGAVTWGYVHIAGGDCTNEVVQHRAKLVQQKIDAGGSLLELLELLRSFSSVSPGRKKLTTKKLSRLRQPAQVME